MAWNYRADKGRKSDLYSPAGASGTFGAIWIDPKGTKNDAAAVRSRTHAINALRSVLISGTRIEAITYDVVLIAYRLSFCSS